MAQAGGIATAALAVLLVVILVVRYWRRRAFMRLTGMPRISVDELHELLSGEEPPLVIDVRGKAGVQVDPRRIPGARSYTLKALSSSAGSTCRTPPAATWCCTATAPTRCGRAGRARAARKGRAPGAAADRRARRLGGLGPADQRGLKLGLPRRPPAEIGSACYGPPASR